MIGDSNRLSQVFLNLLVTAAQAIPEGEAAKHTIHVATRPLSEGLEVEVEIGSSGASLTEEAKARLFEPFLTKKAPGSGLGLGLSICQSIVASMQGRIVTSSDRQGTSVRVILRASPVPATSVAPERSSGPAPAASSPARILVVDDNPGVAKSLQRALEPHHITVASSGCSALELLLVVDFNVVFCDVMMPDFTGVELHEQLRQRRPSKQTLVFMTGGAFGARTRELLEALPNTRVDKPLDLQLVHALIAERLR